MPTTDSAREIKRLAAATARAAKGNGKIGADGEMIATAGVWAQNWEMLQYNPSELIWRKGLDIYDIMMRDDQVKAAILFKIESVLASGWTVVSPEGQPPDWDVTEFVRRRLSSVPDGFDRSLKTILSGIVYGYSITEIILEALADGDDKGLVGIKALKTRAPHRLRFVLDKFGNVLTIRNDDSGNEYPRDKFVVWTFGDQFGNPYGQSDLDAAYRAYALAQNSYKWLGMYLERLGVPFWIALYNPEVLGSPGQQNDLQTILKNLQNATSAAIPRGSKDDFELWSPPNANNVQSLFVPALGMLKADIARALLMPGYLGLSPDQATGSLARARVALDMFLLAITSIQGALRGVIQHQIVEPLCDMNFANPSPYPHFEFLPLGEEDIKAIVDSWVALVDTDIVSADADDEQHLRGLLKFPRSEPDEQPDDSERRPRIPMRYVEKIAKALKVDEIRAALGLDPIGGEEGDGMLETPPPAPIIAPPATDPNNPEDNGPDGGPASGGGAPKPPNGKSASSAAAAKPATAKNEARRGIKPDEPIPEIHEGDFTIVETQPPPKPEERPLTVPEQRVKFQAVSDQLDGLEDDLTTKLVTALRGTLRKQLDAWIKRPPALERAPKIKFAMPPQTRGIFLRSMKKALGAGRAHCRDEAGTVIEQHAAPTFEPTEAIRWLEVFADFFVTALSDALTEVVRIEILNGLRFGLPFTETASRLSDALSPWVGTETIEPAVMKPARLLTIVRTNTTAAYNSGRIVEARRLGKLGIVTGVQHSSQLDSRTTVICQTLDSRCYRIDDPELDRMTPPLHFNCRSIFLPILLTDVISDDPSVELHWRTPEEQAAADRLVPGAFGGSYEHSRSNAP